MKKLIYLFSAVALLCGCEQSDVIDQPNQGGTGSGDLPEVIYATVADNNDKSGKTRTVVAEDGKTILWNTDDAVSAFFSGISNAQYQYDGDDAVATAELKLSMVGYTGMALSRSYAVYPYHEGNTSVLDGGVEKLKVNFPAEQTFAANSFGSGANVMVGVGEKADDTDFYFRNVCGYLVIKLKGEDVTVKSITLTALGSEKIAGKGYITASHDGVPTVTMTDEGSSTITLNCGDGVALGADATEFWFAMPPVTFEQGFKIHVAPTSGLAFEMQTSKQVEITRNDIQPMAALQYTPNVQTSHQLFYTRKDGNTTPLEQFKVGKNTYFDATITAHYYDNKIGQHVIEFGAPLKVIKEDAFKGNDIIAVSLPDQLTTICKNAFRNTAIQELVIPGSVTLIEDYALSYIYTLKRISFLEGNKPLEIRFRNDVCTVTVHDEYAPFHKSALTYIYLNRNINYTDSDGNERFYKNTAGACHGLFRRFNVERDPCELVIGPEVTEILPMMFQECPIVHLVIPGTVNTVRHDAFCKMYDLETVTFLPSPTGTPLEMDGETDSDLTEHSAFYLCDKLSSVTIDREINYINDDITAGEGIFDAKSMLTELTLGEQVKSLTDYMFYNCDALTSVTFPTSLTSIGSGTFENCDGLTSVIISEAITTIGESAFKNCDGLISATLSSSAFGANMFDDCDNLATVTIGGTLDAINADAFSGCSKLSTLNISGSVGAIGDGAFDGFNLTSLNISGHVGTIGANAFDDNDKMTSFTVTGSVGTIGASAFEDSDALTTVSITGIVNEVCSYAFSDCDNVTTLAIHANKVGDRAYEDMDGLISATLYGATVGNGVFYDCNALQTVVIDGGVNSIGDDAFYNCGSLSSVTFNESANKLIIGYQPSSLDDVGPFYQSPLATINLYREIEPTATYKEQLDAWDMGIFTNKHYNNSDLTTTVTLGTNVKTIWPWMFSCVRMQNVTIPASVTSIGKEAFSYCYILEEVTSEGTTAPTLGENVFYDSDELARIYVPSGSLSDYQSKWSEYEDMLHEN